MSDTTFENHYSVAQLARTWNYGTETIRPYVMAEPDIMVVKGRGAKGATVMVPESVARRIHTKMLAAMRPKEPPPKL